MPAMHPTLSAQLWQPPQAVLPRLLRDGALILLGTLLLTLAAKTKVPMWPVPMSMQNGVVLILGAFYGARLGGLTVLAYLLEGAVGLPVFASGGGVAYLLGPTTGYLLSYLPAAVALGFAVERGWMGSLLTAILGFLVVDIAILASGVSWLAAHIGAEKAIATGLLPFLHAEVLKIGLAAALLTATGRK